MANLAARIPIVRDVKRMRQDLARLCMERVLEHHERLVREAREATPPRLTAYEAQVFSQGGEDGILAEIFRRVGVTSRSFLEIGVGDGLENNTTFLLWQGWSGFWVEGSGQSVARIRGYFRRPLEEKRLHLVHEMVTAENVGELLGRHGVPEECDLFSLDVDRNTYWIWNALPRFRPRVAVVEYNASLPPGIDWKVEYHPRRVWDGSLYFGASLTALEVLGRERGYRLVGCSLTGGNAFFVREDLCGDHFTGPFTAQQHYEPPRYSLAARIGHPPRFSDD